MRFIFLIVLLAVAVNWSSAEDQQELEKAIKENEPIIKQKQAEFEKEAPGSMEASKKEEELKALKLTQMARNKKLNRMKGGPGPDAQTRMELQAAISKLERNLKGVESLDKHVELGHSEEKKAYPKNGGYKVLDSVHQYLSSVQQSRQTQLKALKEMNQ